VLSITLSNAASGSALIPCWDYISKAGLNQMIPSRFSVPFSIARLLESSGLLVMSNLYSKILAGRNVLIALIIDREERRRSVARALQQEGFRIIEAGESSDGLHYLQDSIPRIVVMGEDMPPVDNLELLTALRGITDVPIMVMGAGNRGLWCMLWYRERMFIWSGLLAPVYSWPASARYCGAMTCREG
jgi:hypothetical protein